ncbi:MAG TPA: hypothetical protein PKL08_03845 [Thermoanaerobaculaceae bacterium]|nr:hypothetical protein [Thermoanaerobaculaceae bacterium]
MTVPFVVGQWVRGDRFYGRGPELAALLGERRVVWVVGTRRIGKTSLLRQAELLAADPAAGRFPLFWDLQGVDDGAELRASFQDALLDARDRLRALDLDVPEPGEDLPAAVARLAGELCECGRTLLLLADEAEDLVSLLGREPRLAPALLDALAGARVVLASSIRLATLAGGVPEGARLLDALGPPLFLGGLCPDEARALVRQGHLPGSARPPFGGDTVAEICARCGGHPFLLQLLAKRVLGLGEVPAACASVAADPMVGYLFAADLALLAEGDRRVLRALPRNGAAEVEPERARRLESLGLVRRDAEGRPVAGNWFLDQWLRS